jgi:hypothetical protein
LGLKTKRESQINRVSFIKKEGLKQKGHQTKTIGQTRAISITEVIGAY